MTAIPRTIAAMGIFMGGTVSNPGAAGNENSRHPTAGSLIYGLPSVRKADRFRSGLAAARAAPGKFSENFSA
jgi:hypothetical protein